MPEKKHIIVKPMHSSYSMFGIEYGKNTQIVQNGAIIVLKIKKKKQRCKLVCDCLRAAVRRLGRVSVIIILLKRTGRARWKINRQTGGDKRRTIRAYSSCQRLFNVQSNRNRNARAHTKLLSLSPVTARIVRRRDRLFRMVARKVRAGWHHC